MHTLAIMRTHQRNNLVTMKDSMLNIDTHTKHTTYNTKFYNIIYLALNFEL